jgi:general transcription factor 3C polypeptide 3 (transcription factor C subunit 4)
MASLSSGLRPTDSFITSTLQKFFFREMKLSDVAVKDPELLKWNGILKRWAPIMPSTLSSGGRKEKDKDAPEELGDEDSDGGAGGAAEIDTPLSIDKTALPTKDVYRCEKLSECYLYVSLFPPKTQDLLVFLPSLPSSRL